MSPAFRRAPRDSQDVDKEELKRSVASEKGGERAPASQLKVQADAADELDAAGSLQLISAAGGSETGERTGSAGSGADNRAATPVPSSAVREKFAVKCADASSRGREANTVTEEAPARDSRCL